MLPLSGLAASSALSGCGGGGDSTPVAKASFVSAWFGTMYAPTTVEQMATTYVASTLNVKLSDGTTQTSNLAYEPFFLTGTQVPDGKGATVLAGGYYDINNQPIIDATGGTARQYFSDAPDGTSLLTVPNAKVTGVTGNHVFAVVQFEYTTLAANGTTGMYGKLPSPIAVLTLDQNPSTGKLSLVKYHNVDTSGVNGLWITCGASLSPWGTHLSSEEYEPDAFAARAGSLLEGFSQSLYGDGTTANAYNYGHMPEVVVNPDGTGTIKKHYCMGRISHELVEVMPDQRTVLMGDDATNSAYFMFIADKAADLSAGTLYVAKVGTAANASSPAFSIDPTAAAAQMSWIKLGHATSAEIRALVDGGIKPADIMDVRSADPADASFKKVFANGKTEWVKVVAGQEKAAAFLETHRYAALLGASTCFTKMEGTTVNIKDKVAYSALQNIQSSMVKGNARSLPEVQVNQLDAGAVMTLNLKAGQKDTSGANIVSDWVPVDIKALLTGEDYAVADALGNKANPNKIANPDNLKFSEKLRTLFIGEDSGQHTNNFLWAYNVDTKRLARVMSIPAGGESTGLHAVDEINGWTYIMSNFQHAGDSNYVKNNVALNTAINTNYNNKFAAAVGYLTATSTSIKLSKV